MRIGHVVNIHKTDRYVGAVGAIQDTKRYVSAIEVVFEGARLT